MNIQYITPFQTHIYFNSRGIPAKVVPRDLAITPLGADTFAKKIYNKPYTLEWYKCLPQEKKDRLNARADEYIHYIATEERGLYDKNFYEVIQYNSIVADCIKNSLNRKYGEGNYIVIPIGRSLSSIGKCLGYKIGEDKVKSLPMSDARRFSDLKECKDDFGILIRYLNSIGLSKKEVKKSKKHYIFVDYCNTGISLRGIKKLFESDFMYGPLENVHFEDVFDLLPKLRPEQKIEGIQFKEFMERLELLFCNSRFKEFSFVKPCGNFSKLNKAIIKPEEYNKGLKSFCIKLLDKLMKEQDSCKS